MRIARNVCAATLIVAFVGAAPAAAQDSATPETYASASARLERILDAFTYLESRIDRAQFDVAAKAQSLGNDHDRIFAFVRDDVRYEPYYGVLRGAKGTLTGLAGNAADQSVLLKELLEAAGIASDDIRFATGILNFSQADALLAQFYDMRFAASAGPAPLTEDAIERAAELLGPDWPAVQVAQVETGDRALDLQEVLWEDVESDYALLTGLLRQQGVTLGVGDPSTVEDAVRVEARAHTWVQVRDATGIWTDLDPSFSDSSAGRSFAAAHPVTPNPLEILSHTLRIAVTLRTAREAPDGQSPTAEDHVLLDVTVPASALVGESVVLALVPNVPRDPQIAFDQSVARITEFTPTLFVGDNEMFVDKSFGLRGSVRPFKKSSLAAILGEQLATGFKALTARLATATAKKLTEADRTQQAKSGTWIGGLWIDYTLESPSAPGSPRISRTFRREILPSVNVIRWSNGGDVAGNAETMIYRDVGILAARLSFSAALLVPVSATNQAQTTFSQLTALTRNADLLRSLVSVAYGRGEDVDLEGFQSSALSLRLAGFWADRTAASAELASARFGGMRSYLNEPGLMLYERGISMRRGDLVEREGFDIVHNPGRTMASRPGARSVDMRLYEGILETTLERLLVKSPLITLDPDADALTYSTRGVFEAATSTQTPFVVLDGTPESFARLEGLPILAQAKADIASDLTRGYLVIVPERAVDLGGAPATGWWRIAQEDGTALGVMAGGQGQSATERLIIESIIMQKVYFVACVLDAQADGNISDKEGAVCVIAAFAGQIGTLWTRGGHVLAIVGYLVGRKLG